MAESKSTGTVEDYLAKVAAPARPALEKLRATIRSAVPEATEVMSYGVPTFRTRKALVSFGAAKAHCAFYVMSPGVMEAFADELEGYDTSKGTIRFLPDRPLPAALVKRIVKARIAENAGKG